MQRIKCVTPVTQQQIKSTKNTKKKGTKKTYHKLQMIKCVTPVTQEALHSIVSGLNFSILQVIKKKSTKNTYKN